jgi:phytoene synthase
MQTAAVHHETFRNGSQTYFNSTRFFPEAIRQDVYLLYGFVRKADDFVDAVPQDGPGFEAFVSRYYAALEGTPAGDPIIDGYVDLSRRYAFEERWTEAFLKAMRMDLTKRVHATLSESIEYMYGSAEVIGLFMARIMGLSDQAMHSARLLGRAMQYINFIRDIAEDNTFGRTYLPISETSMETLSEKEARANPEEFRRFIGAQIERYLTWQAEAGSRISLHSPAVPRPDKDRRRHVQVDRTGDRRRSVRGVRPESEAQPRANRFHRPLQYPDVLKSRFHQRTC